MQIETVIDYAKEVMLEDGSIVPTLFLVGEKASTVVVADAPMTGQTDRHGLLYAIGKIASPARARIGALTDIYYATEGWSVKLAEGQTKGDLPTDLGNDPRRVEVLQVFHENFTSDRRRMFIYEILRTGENVDLIQIDLYDTADPNIKLDAPIIRAFLRGYGQR